MLLTSIECGRGAKRAKYICHWMHRVTEGAALTDCSTQLHLDGTDQSPHNRHEGMLGSSAMSLTDSRPTGEPANHTV